MREYRGNRGTRGNPAGMGLKCSLIPRDGREWLCYCRERSGVVLLASRGNGCKHFVGVRICIISLSVRNRVCELTIIDSFLKQYMHIVYGHPLFFNVA